MGVRENFFELGGDSILSIQVVARARERSGGDAAADVRARDGGAAWRRWREECRRRREGSRREKTEKREEKEEEQGG